MATEIKFNADGTINFGDYTLTFTDEGFEFDGAILATEYEIPYSFQGSVSGYMSGRAGVPGITNTIDKFPFAVDGDATDVGDLTAVANDVQGGQSSSENGYTSGGDTSQKNVIDKFPFASDANATDVGDLSQARNQTTGQSSTESGYNSGGFVSPPEVNTIDKFPFASDANATDVGDLSQAGYRGAGQQV